MAAAYRGSGGGSRKDGHSQSKEGGKRRRKTGGPLPFHSEAGDAVMVNAYSEKWLGRGFPWVYQEEVTGRTGALMPGQVVRIVSKAGEILGTGVWDDGKIEVRRFREDRGPMDAEFLRGRVAAALARRHLGPETTAWRWISGENDDLPGIRVDVWGAHLAVALDSRSLEGLIDPLVDALTALQPVESIHLGWRPQEGATEDATSTCIWGEAPAAPVEVRELGIRYMVEPSRGLDAGLYPDMRAVRTWLQRHWKNRRVLNTFSYTGAFSVAAAAHGAAEVLTVDLAAAAIERAKENFRLNGLDVDAHGFLAEDTFKVLDRLRRKEEYYDLIIADPPSFSHGPEGTWKGTRDLPRLVSSCLRVLKPGGWLLVASNQGTVSPREFKKMVQAGADKAKRRVRLVHQGSPPHDFPAALHFPESRYLKVWVLEA